MKNLLKKAVIFAVAGIMALSVEAQEEKGVQFTVSGDFVSSYVWIEYLAWGLCQSFGAGVPCANVEKYGYQFRELRFERKR